MKTSYSANLLDQFIAQRLNHSSYFESATEMANEIDSVQDILTSKSDLLADNPFITATYAVTSKISNGNDLMEIDQVRLYRACVASLSMTPIDEISPSSLLIFSSLVTPDMSDSEKFKAANVISKLLIRSNSLDPDSRGEIEQNCAVAASRLRKKGCFPEEVEKTISNNISRKDAVLLIEYLKFDANNIPSMRGLMQSKDARNGMSREAFA